MSVDPNLKLPYVLNYNVGLTHAFGSDLSLEVEYVGNYGYRLRTLPTSIRPSRVWHIA